MHKVQGWLLYVCLLTVLVLLAIHLGRMFGVNNTSGTIIFVFSFIFALQSGLTLWWMLFAWENPHKRLPNAPLPPPIQPKTSFTAIIPARHEEGVIGQTIEAVNRMDYPTQLKQILIVCRGDDQGTIKAATETINRLKGENIKLITFFNDPINKPHGLNEALREAENEVVCIFDAEDQPQPNLYNHVNMAFVNDNADVVQAPVQLINFKSNWFSVFNCLEYFFWFKSGLPLACRLAKIAPLGGNTVFFKRDLLNKLGGWDENCLTEDAEIATRLGGSGAKVKLLTSEDLATLEETPDSVEALIKQRTRWNQGFLQVFTKMDWAKLPSLKAKIVFVYILLSPYATWLSLAYMPFGLVMGTVLKGSLILGLFSYLPFYLLASQVVINLFGLNEFGKLYKLKVPWYYYIKIPLLYFPYQIILAYSSVRAMYKFITRVNFWEKTFHANAHRSVNMASAVVDQALS